MPTRVLATGYVSATGDVIYTPPTESTVEVVKVYFKNTAAKDLQLNVSLLDRFQKTPWFDYSLFPGYSADLLDEGTVFELDKNIKIFAQAAESGSINYTILGNVQGDGNKN